MGPQGVGCRGLPGGDRGAAGHRVVGSEPAPVGLIVGCCALFLRPGMLHHPERCREPCSGRSGAVMGQQPTINHGMS